MGTYGAGIYRYSPEQDKFVPYATEALKGDFIFTLCDYGDELIVGVHEEELKRFNKKTGEVSIFPAPEVHRKIIRYAVCFGDELWVGTQNGVYVINEKHNSVQHIPADAGGKYGLGDEIGGNAEAARFSGINSKKVIWIVYTFAGFLYGIYGVISCSRLYSGQPTLGQGSELTAIAAAVVGGTSMSGGVGRIGATFIGALIMDLLSSGLNFMNVPFYWQYVCQGVVVLGAVFVDLQIKKK